MTFSDFQLHESLLRVFPEIGFENPTPIQQQAIPPVMQGRDVLGSAQTGTGKTAAFMLPILHRLLSEEAPKKGMQVLVLEPTRELALQVEEQAKLFAKHTNLRSTCIYGGASMAPQEKALEDGVEIIAATPGRLLDHMRQGHVHAEGLKVLVLDEVDRMLDMGFLPDVRSILSRLPKKRQTLFFSATVPSEIQHLCDTMLHDPVRVAITPDRKTAEGITQKVYPVADHLKPLLLHRLLTDEQVNSALVFTRTKQGADKVCSVVERHGFSVEVIHGDRSQKERTEALNAFKEGRAKFLVATDIAARGLDVEGISHVINYDLPDSPDDYVHRIGRTARAGATGHAYSLMSSRERMLVSAIEQHIQMKLEKCMLDNFNYDEELGPQHEVRQGHDGIRHFDGKAGSAPARPVPEGRPERNFSAPSAGPARTGIAPIVDADERATITVNRKGSSGNPEAAAFGEASESSSYGSSSGGGGRDRGPRRRGGRGGRSGGGDSDSGRGRPPRDNASGSYSRPEHVDRPAARAPQAPVMSATDVLRRAGSQKAAVESSALDLRPVRPEPGDDARASVAPQAPQENFQRPAAPRERSSFEAAGPGSAPARMEGDRGRRRRRGGRGRSGQGGADRGFQSSTAQGPQGRSGDRNFQPNNRPDGRGPQGGRSSQGRNDLRPRGQEAPKSSSNSPGIWSRIKGALGLGGNKGAGGFDDKW
jgi:ATP-dependent RNA helicase RhlE